MENFIYTLAAMLVSAITLLAYKHPVAYVKIYPILALALLVVVCSLGSWNWAIASYSAELAKALNSLPAEQLNKGILHTFEDLDKPLRFTFFESFLAPCLAGLYFAFLARLHWFIKGASDQT